MKFAPECLSCFLDDIVGALDILNAPHKETLAVLGESLAYLSQHASDELPPSYYITQLHRILKRRLNMDMPFADARKACLIAGIKISKKVEKQAALLNGKERFKFLVRWAVAANSLDFRTAGAGYGLTAAAIGKMLLGYYEKGLTIDQSKKIFDTIKNGQRIVYIPDNVGELPFDKLLIRQLTEYGASVTVPFRGGPITSDAVMADAEAVSMKDAASQIILAGPDTLGISFLEMSADLKKALKEADVIMAKGQANYYVLSEYKSRYPKATIICLFTAKCSHVWTLFGCHGKASLASIIQEPGTKRKKKS
jgi:uncharacterized protein with ATP-grasp and redox domains